MKSILYIIAFLLMVGWIAGLFLYAAKGLIHILVILGFIALLFGALTRSRKPH